MQNFNSANDNDASTPDTNDLATVILTPRTFGPLLNSQKVVVILLKHDNTKDNKY